VIFEVNKTVCDLIATTVKDLDDKELSLCSRKFETLAAWAEGSRAASGGDCDDPLFGILGRAQARKWLIGFVGSEQPHVIRFHTLVALLHCLRGQELHKGEFSKLIPLLEEKRVLRYGTADP